MGHIEEGGGENEEEAIPAKEIAKNLKRQSTCVGANSISVAWASV